MYTGGNNNKNQETRRSSCWICKMSVYPTTKSCLCSCRHPHASSRGTPAAGSRPPAGPGQQGQRTLVTLLLSFSPAFSTQLLNPQCWLCPFVVGSGPGLQLFLCKHKGRARSVCGILILTAVVFTSGGVHHAQERQQISSGPEKTGLPLPPCAFLTSYAQPAEARQEKA